MIMLIYFLSSFFLLASSKNPIANPAISNTWSPLNPACTGVCIRVSDIGDTGCPAIISNEPVVL